MNEFEQKIQSFLDTKHGTEMRYSLGWCFRFIYDGIESCDKTIREMEQKISRLEGKNQNGVMD